MLRFTPFFNVKKWIKPYFYTGGVHMDNGRHSLNEEDIEILNKGKEEISRTIKILRERGIRLVNIEIELVSHIRESLGEE
jgi:hypothetical protein